MELKSVSGYGCYVADIDKTAAFYEALGFRIGEKTKEHLKVYLNWFAIDFIAAEHETKEEFLAEAHASPKGAGMYINIQVADVDEFYKGILERGMKPSSHPRDWPWGNREFVLRDPDGYKLVFFTKK